MKKPKEKKKKTKISSDPSIIDDWKLEDPSKKKNSEKFTKFNAEFKEDHYFHFLICSDKIS